MFLQLAVLLQQLLSPGFPDNMDHHSCNHNVVIWCVCVCVRFAYKHVWVMPCFTANFAVMEVGDTRDPNMQYVFGLH